MVHVLELEGSVTDWNLVRLEILESGILSWKEKPGYFRILHLKVFQLPWNLIWSRKLLEISTESRTLFYFVTDLSIALVCIWRFAMCYLRNSVMDLHCTWYLSKEDCSKYRLMGTCAFHLVVLIWYRLKLRFSSSSYHIHNSMVSVKLPLFFSSVNVEGLIKSITVSLR